MKKELEKLTKRQRQILKFILRFIKKKGYPPTIRDIGKGVGLSSSSTVHMHLNSLEEMGLIERDPSKPRAIRALVPQDYQCKDGKRVEATAPEKEYEDIFKYPLMKGYRPGTPFFHEDNIEKTILLPAELVEKSEGFLLSMVGKSMEGIGIFDGDLCIMHMTDSIKDGEIAAVISNNELTIKRVYGHLDYYRLEPENRRMNPVYVKELTILGQLAGVIRKF